MLLLMVVIGVLLYFGFRLYRKFLLPVALVQENGKAQQQSLVRVEIIAWALFFATVVYFGLKTSLVITITLLVFILLAFFDFWRNYFSGIAIKFSDNFQLDDFITINGHSGRVAEFGNRTLKIITPKGEEILSPYRFVNKEIKIEHQSVPKTLFKTLEINIAPTDKRDVQQTIAAALYTNPWVIISSPIDVAIRDGKATLRFYVLNNELFEKAKQRLWQDLG